jgi:UDP-2,3-diacylglucosamine pyrophosphatase LpxH
MKVYAFSDVHIGKTANYDRFHRFLKTVQEAEPNWLIGCGDVFELVWGKNLEDIKGWDPAREAFEHLKSVAKSTKTVLIVGNHDRDLPKYQEELEPAEIFPCYSVDGVCYLHGQDFDPVEKNVWRRILGTPLKNYAPWLYNRIWGTPFELKRRGKDKSYSKLVGTIEANLQLWAKGKSMVFGHTHSEFIKYRRSQFIANTGDFYDSCSYLVITNGKPELYWV